MRSERQFQTAFSKWLKHSRKMCGAYELKLARGSRLPFSAVKQHQEDALWSAKNGRMVHKISDTSYSPLPFDCFALAGAEAKVVVMYQEDSRVFYMIDIDDWLKEKSESVERSLHVERAKEIGEECSFPVKGIHQMTRATDLDE